MTLEQAKPDMLVLYIPYHAYGDRLHDDCEAGVVSGVTDRFVMVKFIPAIARQGRADATAMACDPENLIEL